MELFFCFDSNLLETNKSFFFLLSVVDKFLKLLSSELLQSDSKAPSGLQLHILDLYLIELAAVGAVEVQICCVYYSH